MNSNSQQGNVILEISVGSSKQSPKTRGQGQSGAIHAIAQSIVARSAMIGINAATGILTARALAPIGRGELSAMIMWPVFLANAMTLGIPNALRYNLKRGSIAAKNLVGAALLLSITLNILTAA